MGHGFLQNPSCPSCVELACENSSRPCTLLHYVAAQLTEPLAQAFTFKFAMWMCVRGRDESHNTESAAAYVVHLWTSSYLQVDMAADHQKRATNQEELLRCLKEVNQIIQQASRVRVGTFKTQKPCNTPSETKAAQAAHASSALLCPCLPILPSFSTCTILPPPEVTLKCRQLMQAGLEGGAAWPGGAGLLASPYLVDPEKELVALSLIMLTFAGLQAAKCLSCCCKCYCCRRAALQIKVSLAAAIESCCCRWCWRAGLQSKQRSCAMNMNVVCIQIIAPCLIFLKLWLAVANTVAAAGGAGVQGCNQSREYGSSASGHPRRPQPCHSATKSSGREGSEGTAVMPCVTHLCPGSASSLV
eukprot:1145730-Pelagomonas_calceolata.AAC.7